MEVGLWLVRFPWKLCSSSPSDSSSRIAGERVVCMSAGRPEGTKLPRGVSPAFHSAGNRALSGVLGSGDKIAESLLTACGVVMPIVRSHGVSI